MGPSPKGLLENLEIFQRKEANGLGYVKAGCSELLDGLRFGNTCGAIDVDDSAALPE